MAGDRWWLCIVADFGEGAGKGSKGVGGRGVVLLLWLCYCDGPA
jgi:hypothetical protein